ncbi:hypothetical protein NL676_003515 [Syzygium grande]|nr:hypothetical protein NL676_003515 [Syzygium grande]
MTHESLHSYVKSPVSGLLVSKSLRSFPAECILRHLLLNLFQTLNSHKGMCNDQSDMILRKGKPSIIQLLIMAPLLFFFNYASSHEENPQLFPVKVAS